MKRSEINRIIESSAEFLSENRFFLPEWAGWSPETWATKGKECREIKDNRLGWDVTDFGKGRFSEEGLTLVTIRNGNPAADKKPYCEKIMIVREHQITPIHFHWYKMEDIINRGGGDLCIKIWESDSEEKMIEGTRTMVQIDGISTSVISGETFRLRPGQSITFTPGLYHTFWAENGTCMAGEVSTVNDDANDNRFYEPLGRYPAIEEDEPARYLLCNEYPELK